MVSVDGVLEKRGSRYPGGGGPKPVGCTGMPVLVAAFSSCTLTVRGVTVTNCSLARKPLTCTRSARDVPWVASTKAVGRGASCKSEERPCTRMVATGRLFTGEYPRADRKAIGTAEYVTTR